MGSQMYKFGSLRHAVMREKFRQLTTRSGPSSQRSNTAAMAAKITLLPHTPGTATL